VRGFKWLTGAALSPDGKEVAYSADYEIATVPIAGGTPTVWRIWDGSQMDRLAGWWRNGIGVYVESNGDSPVLQPLDLFARRGATPKRLFAYAAVNGYAENVRGLWPSTSPGHPATFEPTVTPGWSADGRTLVWANPLFPADETSKSKMNAWLANHPTHVYDAATRTTRGLPAAAGGTMFAVAPGGKGVVFVRQNALWLLLRLDAKAAVTIADWVYPRGVPPQFYPDAAFSGELSWAD
jgi:hypothetical protein